MQVNKLRQLVESGEFGIGTMVQMPSEAIVEILGYVGFDFLVLDMEHTSYDMPIESLVRVAQGAGLPSFVRLWGVDPYLIKKTLDTGVEGLMLPLASSREEVARLVTLSKVAPVGKRGVCPETRSGWYFNMPIEDYRRLMNEVVIGVMIETKEGLDNVEEILSVPGVDVVRLGQYDLCFDMGVELDDPAIAQAHERVIRAARANGVRMIQQAFNPKDMQQWVQKHEDLRLFALRTDHMMISIALASLTGECRELGLRDLPIKPLRLRSSISS